MSLKKKKKSIKTNEKGVSDLFLFSSVCHGAIQRHEGAGGDVEKLQKKKKTNEMARIAPCFLF